MKASRNSTVLHRCVLETLESRQLMAASTPGALDPAFTGDGKFSLRFGLDQSPVYTLFAEDVAVQPDGKTVIAAKFDQANQFGDFRSDFALVRLKVDGTLDTSFGTPDHPGFSIVHLGKSGERVVVNTVALQSDGKIVVAGGAIRERSFHEDPLEMVVARFTPKGNLDNSFDGDGARFIEFDGSVADDIAIQKDGKIVLVGTKFEGFLSGFDNDFAIARLNANGSLDSSFDGDGMKTIGFGDRDEAHGVTIDGSGRIVIVGSSGSFEDERLVIKRLNSNGSSDSSFGLSGTVKTQLDRFDYLNPQDVLIQGSGKIVVLAEGDSDLRAQFANRQFVLLRYSSGGTLDASFGGSGQGFVETGFGGDDLPGAIVQSPLGGLIAGGTTNGKFALASYNGDGVLNTTFGSGGKVITDFGADGTARRGGLAYGPGRRIVMVGGDVLKAARYLDTGANTVSVLAVNPPTDLQAAERTPGQIQRTASFIVDRNEVLPVTTRVFFNFGGTAINNVDFTTNLSKVLTLAPNINIIGRGPVSQPAQAPGQAFIDIPAGKSFVTVTMTPTDDTKLEGVETASFSIVPNAGYNVSALSSVTATIEDNDSVFVNFQAPGPVPTSPLPYVGDVGQIFGDRGNGLTYGWDADNTANARTRHNPGSIDARFDSLIKMQDGVNRKWEIAVPNGMYSVQLDVGDPDFTDSVYALNLEGKLAISGTPSGQTRWFERSFNIQVNDGRLTVSNAAGAVNNKIDFIHITPAAPGAVEGPTSAVRVGNLVPPAPSTPAARVIAARLFSQVLI